MAEREIHFVLGTGRCGSTLVHEVLCQHPGVGFLSNLEDMSASFAAVARFNGPLYRRLPPSITQKGRARFAPSEGYRVLEREVSPLLAMADRDLLASDAVPWVSERLRNFFRQRSGAQYAPLFLHKFTGWPRARFLHQVFPDARFVHVVRDGRAVANSWLQMPWWLGFRGPEHWHWGPLPKTYADEWEASGRSFVVLAGIAWKLLLDALDEARAELPAGALLEIKYEDVIADPPRAFEDVRAFLGIPADSAWEQRVARYTFGSSRLDAYRADLGDEATRRLTQSLAGHLLAHGYDL